MLVLIVIFILQGQILSSYQVTYMLGYQETIEREFGAYDGIADNYPKYVLSMDKFDMSRNGIIHRNIIDFLLKKYWTELSYRTIITKILKAVTYTTWGGYR